MLKLFGRIAFILQHVIFNKNFFSSLSLSKIFVFHIFSVFKAFLVVSSKKHLILWQYLEKYYVCTIWRSFTDLNWFVVIFSFCCSIEIHMEKFQAGIFLFMSSYVIKNLVLNLFLWLRIENWQSYFIFVLL